MAKKIGGVMGIWLKEADILNAAAKVRDGGYEKFDAITPYPVHGMEDACGLKRSNIPWVTFFAGLTGCLFGLWFTWWTSAVDWPVNVGGKPAWSLPAFIPVIFELTILFAALSSVGALFAFCGLPKVNPPVIDPDLTCHKFGLMIYENDGKYSASEIEAMFKELGAEATHVVAEY